MRAKDRPAQSGEQAAWIAAFPCFARLNPDAKSLIQCGAELANLPAGSKVFEPGQPCSRYILVWRGCVRVYLTDADGHTITLYRLSPGDSCVLTTAAILSGEPYAAYATAETDVQAVLIEANIFHRLLVISDEFRQSVFMDHGQRIVDLMGVVGDVAFDSIDHRLARKLQELAGGEANLLLTHEALACELGTAREVVSRRLKEFERRGWLRLHKGRIEILQMASISACAAR